MARKKRRSAAQIAATKKLVAFNKKRRGKKVAKKKRKKRRTAKQIAATRKLVALNKKRRRKNASAGPKMYRTKKRRKNPKRKTLAKSHLWVAFVCTGMKVYFAYITDTRKARVGISDKKSKSVLFRTKQRAHDVAKLLAKGWPNSQAGVAPDTATSAQIVAACGGKT